MSELEKLQGYLMEHGYKCFRMTGKSGEQSIQVYVGNDPSWFVVEEESGLLTYADPCASARHKTASDVIHKLEWDE